MTTVALFQGAVRPPARFRALILTGAGDHHFFRPGQSLLHRADPRLKLPASLLLVMLGFAAANWQQLAAIGVVSLLAASAAAPRDGTLWRFCWKLRWLLLFTLLMHLLLTPGRTLWGTSWLSLDGLLTGVFVCTQILVAIATSVLLGMTTSTDDLAGAFGWYVRPLSLAGCRTEEWQGLLKLSLEFMPVVREELRAAGTGPAAPAARDLRGRWRRWTLTLQEVLMRLVDRGDSLARRLAAGEIDLPGLAESPPLLPLSRYDQGLIAVVSLAILVYWQAG